MPDAGMRPRLGSLAQGEAVRKVGLCLGAAPAQGPGTHGYKALGEDVQADSSQPGPQNRGPEWGEGSRGR